MSLLGGMIAIICIVFGAFMAITFGYTLYSEGIKYTTMVPLAITIVVFAFGCRLLYAEHQIGD